MSYFRTLWDDTRRVLSGYTDLLVISLVASLTITASYYHYLRVPGVSPDMRGALEILGRGLFFAVPAFISALILKIPLKELGFSWGEPKKWLRDVLLLYFIMLPLIWFASRQPDFKLTYPYFRLARQGWPMLILAEAIQLVFMFCWEFMSRGYILFGFYRKIGYAAVAVSVMPFVLLHINKPELEAYGSAIAALALAVVAIRSKSFYPAVILHFAVAATLDVLSVIHI